MSSRLFFIVVFALTVNLSFGQDHKVFKGSREYLGDFRPVRREVDYSKIKGSPYASEKLMQGYVLFSGGDSLRYFLRYNIYADEMEYLEGEDLMLVKNVKDINHVFCDMTTYIHLEYSWLNKVKSGYLIPVIDGPVSIYKKMNVRFEDAKPAKSSYEASKPPIFKMEADALLYSYDGRISEKIHLGNKVVDQVFPTHQDQLREYIKSNKIKVKKEEGLIQLVKYYNDLILKELVK